MGLSFPSFPVFDMLRRRIILHLRHYSVMGPDYWRAGRERDSVTSSPAVHPSVTPCVLVLSHNGAFGENKKHWARKKLRLFVVCNLTAVGLKKVTFHVARKCRFDRQGIGPY